MEMVRVFMLVPVFMTKISSWLLFFPSESFFKTRVSFLEFWAGSSCDTDQHENWHRSGWPEDHARGPQTGHYQIPGR